MLSPNMLNYTRDKGLFQQPQIDRFEFLQVHQKVHQRCSISRLSVIPWSSKASSMLKHRKPYRRLKRSREYCLTNCWEGSYIKILFEEFKTCNTWLHRRVRVPSGRKQNLRPFPLTPLDWLLTPHTPTYSIRMCHLV